MTDNSEWQDRYPRCSLWPEECEACGRNRCLESSSGDGSTYPSLQIRSTRRRPFHPAQSPDLGQGTGEVCYEVKAAEDSTQEIATPAVDVQDDIPTAQSIQQQQSSRPEKVAAVQDISLSPTDVLRAIIAQKLKKSLADVTPRLSIKDLPEGKPPS